VPDNYNAVIYDATLKLEDGLFYWEIMKSGILMTMMEFELVAKSCFGV
jgi:hypothetical protein